jgi:predicted ATPase
MAASLRRHDQMLREVVERHGGRVFKTVGDACCAAFWRASDALAGALAGQRALAAEDWSAIGELKVRMALHSGATDEREGDYFGPAVNRVARLLSVAYGGQVIVSGATASLLRELMPEQTQLLDLGEHRLKDLVEPEHVWQLMASDLPQEFPPLRSLGWLPNNLPRQPTPLIGRESEIAQLTKKMQAQRIVTIVGAGGVGKTRVALQVGADLLDGSGDGVWFVDLAPLKDPTLVASTVAAALGVRDQPKRSALETLLRYLERKRLLLILDNCEHLIDDTAKIADAILRDGPEVRLLATSREPLRIPGELVYSMPTLPVPPSEGATAEGVFAYGAAALFVERARAADSRFELTENNAAIVADIVQRLDGLPLAIELAAARMKALGIEDLAQRLGRKLAILTSGNRVAPPRQQTMRSTIEWSYDLLSEQERHFFRRFSIFVGSVSFDAVLRCAAGDGLDEPTAVELLASLVDKSLAHIETNEEKRYRLLESTREFAAAELDAHGERPAAARAHALTFMALAEDLEAAWSTMPDQQWGRLVAPELENWRAALEWSLAGDEELLVGLRLLTASKHVWFFSPSERRRWLARARHASGNETPTSVAAKLDLCEAQLYALIYQWDMVLDVAGRAERVFSEVGDDLFRAQAQRYVGYALTRLGSVDEGEAALQAALKIYQQRNEERAAAGILHDIGDSRNVTGDIAGAREYYEAALQTYQATGAQESVVGILRNLAEGEFRAGEVRTALDLGREALAFDRQSNNALHIINDLLNICAYEIALGNFDDARAFGLEAIALGLRNEADVFLVVALQHMAAIAALQPWQEAAQHIKRQKLAARLLGFVEGRMAALNVRRGHTEQQEYDATMAALHAELDTPEIERLSEEGAGWNEERAIAQARLA